MRPDARGPLVLHVIHHLVIGGMENGLVNLINRTPDAGYRHAIACVEDYSDFRKRLTRTDVEVVPLHRSRIGVWRLRKALFDLCRRLQPAIVHTRGLSGLDALLPARLAGVRSCVHGEHGWDVQDLDGKRLKPLILRRLHAPLVSRYVAVSRHLEDYLVSRVGIARSRITRICNGVDTARFTPDGPRAADLPWSVEESSKPFVFGTVGRVNRVKNQGALLEAFAGLVAQHSDTRERLRLMIVGNGALLEELRARVAQLGLTDLVWLPGARDDIPCLMRAIDVFVLPSLNEGISNTVLEAMATGLPVIAARVGGNPELVEGGTGRLYDPAEPRGLLNAMLSYHDNPGAARSDGAAGRTRVNGHYSLDSMVSGYLRLYRDLTV